MKDFHNIIIPRIKKAIPTLTAQSIVGSQSMSSDRFGHLATNCDGIKFNFIPMTKSANSQIVFIVGVYSFDKDEAFKENLLGYLNICINHIDLQKDYIRFLEKAISTLKTNINELSLEDNFYFNGATKLLEGVKKTFECVKDQENNMTLLQSSMTNGEES